jgi:mono/diheme cytochrome c family protein
VQGASDALHFMTLWVQTVRAPILPLEGTGAERNAGRTIFRQNCATCHGGAKWTKSQILYANNPTFNANIAVNPAAQPRDPGVSNLGAQIESYTVFEGTPDEDTLQYLEDVETFDATDPLEIRATGATALGVAGFNVPALLGLRYHAPYLHHGKARNLTQLFELHALGAGTIASTLNATQRSNLRAYLLSIDGSTRAQRSDADRFRDGIAD